MSVQREMKSITDGDSGGSSSSSSSTSIISAPAAEQTAEEIAAARVNAIAAATENSNGPLSNIEPDENGVINTPEQRCTFIDTGTKEQCTQTTTVAHLCPAHLSSDLGLEVKQSLIADAGMGLFATKLLKEGHEVPYTGDYVDPSDAKYGAWVLKLSDSCGHRCCAQKQRTRTLGE